MSIADRAWAAGFFDGEGHARVQHRRGRFDINLAISQNHRQPLDRFRDCMLGMGRVYGPYQYGTANPYWTYRVWRYDEVVRCAWQMWPYLLDEKRHQLGRAIRVYAGYLGTEHELPEILGGRWFQSGEAGVYR